MLKRKRVCLVLENLEVRAMASDTLLGVACSMRWASASAAGGAAASAPVSRSGLAAPDATTPVRLGGAIAQPGRMVEKAAATAGRLVVGPAVGPVAGSDTAFADASWAWPDELSLGLAQPAAARGGLAGPRSAAGMYLSAPVSDGGAAIPSSAPDGRGVVATSQPPIAAHNATTTVTDLQAAAVLSIPAVSAASRTHGSAAGQADRNLPPPPGSGYQVSWYSGAYDSSGAFMGATEVMQLVAYKGMLFAGTSCWADVPGNDPVVGAEILRLDGPHDQWQVDADFTELLPSGAPRYVRIGAMSAVTFTRDGDGNPLPQPVSMLLAAPSDQLGVDAVYSRNDDTGTWTPMVLVENPIPGGIRGLGFYQDSVTGIQEVFAGSAAGGLFSGVYDPTAPGRIRWNLVPELVPDNRFMAFAQADGALYTVVQPALYRRDDGPLPTWDTVYTYAPPPVWASGLRGLTTIANPTGPGDALLSGKEGLVADMLRFDPNNPSHPVVELYVQNFLRQHWGSGYSLSDNYDVLSYNDVPQYTDPRTGETVGLVTLLAHSPNTDQARSAWFLVRHANATYDLHEVPALPTPNNPDPSLRATRSIVVSPFPEDRGQVFYLAGYDVSEMPSHNTGWIYRGTLDAVLGSAPLKSGLPTGTPS